MTTSALVTGGTDGIGRAVAAELAGAGQRVYLVGRDRAKGARVEREIRGSTGNAQVHFIQADLTLVREAHRLARQVAARCAGLQYLVHSAGMVRGRREVTVEGVESNFAVNYLTRFALTTELLPLLETASEPGRSARVVFVGGAVKKGRIHYRDINLANGFSTVAAIRQFQQANNVITVELARRLARTRSHITITCLQPGMVTTNISHQFPRWMRWAVTVARPLLALPPQRIAESIVVLLCDPAWEGVTGAHFSYIRSFRPTQVPAAHDPEAGAMLWALSEHLIARVWLDSAPDGDVTSGRPDSS
ncbi:MAG: SDR family NAD(P)-dependent oxidoreductase [Mycobacterium sp.]|nr:SDR family NAD(P)-dependent oxidoreductase [Mycobacterium sp.]